MARDRFLRLYCDGAAQKAFRHGGAHMAVVVRQAFEEAGWPVHLHTSAEAATMPDDGYAMVINLDPGHLFCLNMRNAYLPQFWRIEESNHRAMFSVAQAAFDPERIDPVRARDFVQKWRAKVLGGRPVTREGFVFIPLQGRLLEKRVFQTMSPIEMIQATLQADPGRPVKATLHPRESYDPETLAALDRIASENPRFELARGNSLDLLCACDYVVTETSGMAMQGYFAAKPAVLFGRIDFHHIAANVTALGVEEAFAQVRTAQPTFQEYLFWFLRQNAIGQHFGVAPQKIRDRCRVLGWPV